MPRRAWSLLVAAFLLSRLFARQDAKSPPMPGFRANASLVLVPVTVLDRRGAPVTGLRAGAFQVLEDRVSQPVFSFAQQDVPASIGVVLDMSGSMQGSIAAAKTALQSFLSLANPEDETALYAVSGRPARVLDFTNAAAAIPVRLALAPAQGSTALIDTVYLALNGMRSARCPRKALLILSDGMDNHSRYNAVELLNRVREADVQVYSIAWDRSAAYDKPISLAEQQQGRLLLDALAQATGGLSFVVRDPQAASRAAAAISRAIRDEYTLAYVPFSLNRDGKWRSIHVRLSVPGLRVYSRAGYYAH